MTPIISPFTILAPGAESAPGSTQQAPENAGAGQFPALLLAAIQAAMLRMAPPEPRAPEPAVPEPPATLAEPEDPPSSEAMSQEHGAAGRSAPPLPLSTPGWVPAASRQDTLPTRMADPGATPAPGKAADELPPLPVLSTDPAPAAAPSTAPEVRQLATDEARPLAGDQNVGPSAEIPSSWPGWSRPSR